MSVPLPEHAREQVRKARGRFAAMACTYCLGVFNDNFFKQAISLLAIYSAYPRFQGMAAMVFTVPWLLFSAHAGWLADRFPKRNIVIAAKALELLAMVCGALGVVTMNWGLLFVMLFIMSLQSTIFSPSLNGSIPDLYPREYVVPANARLKMITTCGILVGIILGGVALRFKQQVHLGAIGPVPLGQVIVGAGVVLTALVGWLISFAVPYRPAAAPDAPFPWSGPIESVRELWRLRRDRLLSILIVLDAFVWFVALFQALIINHMGRELFGLSEAQTSYLLTAELLGVALGGRLAAAMSRDERRHRFFAPALLGLSVVTLTLAAVPYFPEAAQLPLAVGLLTLAGAAGGLLLVPVESFFQTRPAPEERGTVIAAANFAAFVGMMVAGLGDTALCKVMTAAERFGLLGVLALVAALWLWRALATEKTM